MSEKTNIGLVGLWFERGNAYLTAGLRSMLLGDTYEPFVYARTGIIVSSKKGRQYHMEKSGRWDVPNVERIETYDIDPGHFASWVKQNAIEAVIWNEEINHELIRRVKYALRDYKTAGGKPVAQIAYLDWVGGTEWIQGCSVYDSLICATDRTQRLYNEHKVKTYRFQWSVDLDLFRPSPRHSRLEVGNDRGFLFFHSAGWGGTNWRKGSLHVLNAWKSAFGTSEKDFKPNPVCYPPRLLFHTQKPVEEYGTGAQKILREDPRVVVVEGTVTAPGLYHQGMVYLGPSRLEGLGLTLPEALACGMHVVTTDYPPMNEHGDASCTTRLPVRSETLRGDRIAFPQVDIDFEDLAKEMKKWARLPKDKVYAECVKARQVAESMYDTKKNGPAFQEMLGKILESHGTHSEVSKAESKDSRSS